MLKYLLAATALAAIAAPAAATDNSGYVGIEGGALFPTKQSTDGTVTFTNTGTTNYTSTDVATERYKTGYDLDVIGGYDFGMFRLEGELGYKRAKAKSVTVNSAFLTAINGGAGTTYTTSTTFGLDNPTSVYSAMVNALLDLGGQSGIGAYVGGGAGYASIHDFGASKGKFAWQLIAGVYTPVANNLDIGLKYRYFRTGRLTNSNDFPFVAGTGSCGTATCSPGTATFNSNDRFTSHSLLASLVYNFGAPAPAPIPAAMPAPPPPPPPVAPATQTCPDGSVILASDPCPAPPPPPPPPPPVERGERGQ